jgi:uracil-DNA glycosylase
MQYHAFTRLMSQVASMDHPHVTASLLRWWTEAGVDVLIDEAPRQWLGGNVAAPAAELAAPTEDPLPDTLAKLVEWISATETLAFVGPPSRRLAPIGTVGSPVMIITDMPEHADIAAGGWFSGDVGQLFDAMLHAVNLTRDQVYCAGLCPGRPATGQIEPDQMIKLGDIARHHIRLAAPNRVWLLGQSTSRAVLGADVAPQTAKLHYINQDGGNVPCVASYHPRMLIQHPVRKAKAWADMQLLFGGMNT